MATAHDAVQAFLSAWTAAELKADTAWLAANLTDDFVGVGPLGFTLPKQAWLARHLGSDLKYTAFDLDEVQTRVYGDAALVIAHQAAEATYQGSPVPGHLRVTLVLMHQDGSWKLASIHMSFIAGTPGAPPVPGQR